jgi:hypothetical protein
MKILLLPIFFIISIAFSQQSTIFINEFMASNTNIIQDEYGGYEDWIEIYNATDSTFNIGGLFFSDDISDLKKWQLPDTSNLTVIDSMGFLVLWADADTLEGPLHIGFRLSASGESLFLTDSNGITILDQISFPEQFDNISYGRQPNGSENWFFFNNPTPGSTNESNGLFDQANPPEFSLQGGFYDSNQELMITSEYSDSLIFYTFNGSIPTINSYVYNGPININSSSFIRARVINEGLIPSEVISHSYFINSEVHLPTVSLITDPTNLWGSDGILDNKYKDWEKPVHLEFFDDDHKLGFQLTAGIKIHSPDGRPQQSFRIYARNEYGQEYVNYKIFKDKAIDIFYVFILRNGGNDGSQLENGTHIRDPFAHTLYRQINPDNAIAASKPAHVYLNGSYWGIYNLRERQDKQYIETNYNYTGDIDFLERAFDYPGNRNAIEGDWIHYDAMRQYIVDNDLNNQLHYAYIESLMDINNFTDYWIFEIFIGNFDWLSNNIKFWRPKTFDGIWKWVLWDVDHGMGLPYLNYGDPAWNTLNWATGTTGDRVDNGNNTIIIRGLLKNEKYKIYFINRFADLLNGVLLPKHTIALMDEFVSYLNPDIDIQLNRWNQTRPIWEHNLAKMRDYLFNRPQFVRQHILNKFDLSGTYDLAIDIQPSGYGSIKLNSIKIDTFLWKGKYFKSVPIQLIAKPSIGYVFNEWSFETDSLENYTISGDTLEFIPFGDINLTAKFSQDTFPHIIINEINYYSSNSFDPKDWIELYNCQTFPIDISGWKFKDDANSYTIPNNIILDPDQYIVLCQDKDDFEEIFGSADYAIGNLNFGLDRNGESLRLFNDQNILIDSVDYRNSYPWPTEPNGAGNTLELTDPMSDNTLAQNWAASKQIGGTPGWENSTVTSITYSQNLSPEKFQLFQNYPNPFNPFTTIGYSVKSRSHVVFKVFNIQGKQVETLVNRTLEKGWYSAKWDAQRYSTGVYFYLLEIEGKIIAVKKALYIK